MIDLARRTDSWCAPTTPGQRTDWRIHHSRPDNSCLNLAEKYALYGLLDKNAIAIAVDQLVARHEALRTRFDVRGAGLVQLIEDDESPIRPRLTIARETSDVSESDWLSEIVARPFDLSADVPVRISLLERSRGDHLFAVVMHHIISDRLSVGIAMDDLTELIAAQLESREPRLPSLPVQFADYAAWYQAKEASGKLDRSFAYWRDRLAGAPEITPLPTNPPTSAEATSQVGQIPLSAAQLSACARQLRTTQYVVLLAMFSSALSELTGADDQVIGCAYANRSPAALQHGVGRLVNQIPLRMGRLPATSLIHAVAAAHEVAMSAYANAVVPLDAVLERGLAGETSSSIPYTNIALQLLNDTATALSISGVTVQPLAAGSATVRRDLNVAVVRSAGQLTLYLDYRPSSIAPAWIRSLADEFADRLCRLVAATSTTTP
jgi:hypothetical protein